MAVPYPDITGALSPGAAPRGWAAWPRGCSGSTGGPCWRRSLELFGRLFGASLLVVNDPAPYAAFDVPRVADLLPGRGAPGGLHAALAAPTTPWVFAAGCDMPFLSAAGDRAAGRAPRRGRWRWCRAGTAASSRSTPSGRGRRSRRWSGRWPRGTCRCSGWPALVGAVVVEPEDWRAVDPAGRAFLNANTPEEAARLGLTT